MAKQPQSSKVTRIGAITDAHANLPALQACLAALDAHGCNLIVHTGDAIGIGPHPSECLEVMLAHPKVILIAGNHESMLLNGIEDPLLSEMNIDEIRHHEWTGAQISDALKMKVAQWPRQLTKTFGGAAVSFVHYGLQESDDFVDIVKGAEASDLDRAFQRHDSGIIFHGHSHIQYDVQGRARYVNVGSLGCYTEPIARFCIARFEREQCSIEFGSTRYDDSVVFGDFECRQVPDRQVIYKAFFGNRFA